jgi:hypothetical protein
MVIFIMSVVCVSEARRQPSSWASNLKIGNGESFDRLRNRGILRQAQEQGNPSTGSGTGEWGRRIFILSLCAFDNPFFNERYFSPPAFPAPPAVFKRRYSTQI